MGNRNYCLAYLPLIVIGLILLIASFTSSTEESQTSLDMAVAEWQDTLADWTTVQAWPGMTAGEVALCVPDAGWEHFTAVSRVVLEHEAQGVPEAGMDYLVPVESTECLGN